MGANFRGILEMAVRINFRGSKVICVILYSVVNIADDNYDVAYTSLLLLRLLVSSVSSS